MRKRTIGLLISNTDVDDAGFEAAGLGDEGREFEGEVVRHERSRHASCHTPSRPTSL